MCVCARVCLIVIQYSLNFGQLDKYLPPAKISIDSYKSLIYLLVILYGFRIFSNNTYFIPFNFKGFRNFHSKNRGSVSKFAELLSHNWTLAHRYFKISSMFTR